MIFLHVSCGDLNSNLGEINFGPEIDQTLREPYTVGARERSSSVSIGFAGLPGAKDKITKEKKLVFIPLGFYAKMGGAANLNQWVARAAKPPGHSNKQRSYVGSWLVFGWSNRSGVSSAQRESGHVFLLGLTRFSWTQKKIWETAPKNATDGLFMAQIDPI